MNVDKLTAIADISMVMIGEGLSLSSQIAQCLELIEKRGLQTNVHALGTNVEGPLSQILLAVAECHELLHSKGIARIVTEVRVTTRTDKPQSIVEKIESVTSRISR